MQTSKKYVLDSNTILEKTYDLLCTFFANKEISRVSDPNDSDAPLAALEARFFEAKVSRLLIEIAASLRVLSDQISKLPAEDIQRKRYDLLTAEVDGYHYDLFNDPDLSLREACNKIIHSDSFEPHSKDGVEGHESDPAYTHGDDAKSVHWRYVSNLVRLSGKRGKENWHVLLDIEVFVKAVFKVLG